ncbi:hypothetical protein DFS34DRAFT_366017 [Phlyctochytrium arcticum]|nr:hypothetical protein DFS34DRAFT_366017 [Phlyctochytrium arcticum]
MGEWMRAGLLSASDVRDYRILRSAANTEHVPLNGIRPMDTPTIHIPATPYFEVWERRLALKGAFKTLYKFSMATDGGQLNGFHVFHASSNAMKSVQDIRQLFSTVSEFAANYDGAMFLVGDFYVWRNMMKLLWSVYKVKPPPRQRAPTASTLEESMAALGRGQVGLVPTEARRKYIPWPNMMHVALNAQLALLQWAFGVIMPLWNAAFPDGPISLVNLRPIRRVMILTIMLWAWKAIRQEVLRQYHSRKNSWTAMQTVLVESLIRLFDEDIPLVLDACAAIGDRDVSLMKGVLLRLLSLFIRFDKKNYVVIILYVHAAIKYYEDMSPADRDAMYSFLPVASSEDLEVFHSLLRAVLRPWDAESICVLKALYISALPPANSLVISPR